MDRAPRTGAGVVGGPEDADHRRADRRGEGLVTAMSVRENTTLPSLGSYSTSGIISKARETVVAKEQITSLRIKTPGAESLVRNLSGGNQQKVAIGKWLAMGPKVLILDEPTRGIDVGAKQAVYQLIAEMVAQGLAVILVSSELPEVMHLAHRTIVMRRGRPVSSRSSETVDCTHTMRPSLRR